MIKKHAPFLLDEEGRLIAAGSEDIDTMSYVPWIRISAEHGTRGCISCQKHWYAALLPKSYRPRWTGEIGVHLPGSAKKEQSIDG